MAGDVSDERTGLNEFNEMDEGAGSYAAVPVGFGDPVSNCVLIVEFETGDVPDEEVIGDDGFGGDGGISEDCLPETREGIAIARDDRRQYIGFGVELELEEGRQIFARNIAQVEIGWREVQGHSQSLAAKSRSSG